MTTLTPELGAQSPTQALLQLCKRLERAWSLAGIVNAVAPVAQGVLGLCTLCCNA